MPPMVPPPGDPGVIAQDSGLAARSNLTTAQLLLWTGQQLEPEAPLYNMVLAFTIDGPLDRTLFAAAFQALLDRSDALRTVVVQDQDGVPQRRERAPFSFALPVHDLSATADPPAAAEEWIAGRARQPFPAGALLWDTALLQLAPERHVWYLNQHHLITDGWSCGVVYRRMAEYYARAGRNELAVAPSLPSFEAYAAHERAHRQTSQYRRAAAYWQAKIADPPEPIRFYGQPAAAAGSRSVRVACDLGPARSQRLRALIQEPGLGALTPDLALFNLFAALLFAYLHRISDQSELVIGAPAHNRPSAAFKETIGVFIEVCPLKLSLDPDETFVSLVGKVARESLDLLRYAQPGTSSAGANRAYDVLLNFINVSFPDFDGRPVQADWVHAGAGDANHRLRLQVHDFADTGSFRLHFDFNTAVFDARRQEWAVRHFLAVVDACLDDPGRSLGGFSLLTEAESRRLVDEFNDTTHPFAIEQTVVDLFEAQVALTPEAVAVSAGSQRLSYRQLDERARRLAGYMVSQGIGPGDLVGVCLEHSLETMVALLAVLKAGAAYVPLDPTYPTERLAFMLADAGVVLVLTQARLRHLLPDGQVPLFCLDTDWEQTAGVAGPSLPRTSLQDRAYVIFTSGSTGRPKAVPIDHLGLSNYLLWARERFAPEGGLAFPLFSSLAFDLTVTSIFTPLIAGGQVVVYAADGGQGSAIQDIVADNAVDVVKLTPAHLALIAHLDLSASRIRRLVVGGEDFKRDLAVTIHERFDSRVEIYNEYGPTEAVVGCMLHRFNPEADEAPSVPIGRPIANARVYLLDRYSQPVPPGVIGEMVIGGVGVARGYLNRPALSAARFRPDLFRSSGRLYHTGDLARWDESGRLVFLGRADHQVKVGSARIELAEIEAALQNHPLIVASAVDVRQRQLSLEAAPRHCVNCGLPENFPGAVLAAGLCRLCREYDRLAPQVQSYFRTNEELERLLARMKGAGDGDYDCLVLLSGGKDSTYVLYRLVQAGLRVLGFTLDNGYISESAKANIRRVTAALGVDHVFGQTPAMKAIFVDSLQRYSNVCNGCFKTIYTLSLKLALERGIRFIVTGLSRGQFFETRLTLDLFRHGLSDEQIDRAVLDARKAYHRRPDAVAQLLDVSFLEDDSVLERIEFVDFYRYCDVELHELYAFLAEHAPWVRPADTGRSTNCLINDVGIYVHQAERGYHNYALPYSWDVRLGHKQRDEALSELDDDIDQARVTAILNELGYQLNTHTRPEKMLVAYYVPTAPLTVTGLRDHLARQLPGFMIPTHFVALDTLPLTANGKVDRPALPDPGAVRPALANEYAAPRNEVERRLAHIWADILRLDRVGIHDNFFELGADSIIYLQVVARANQAGLQLSPRQLFEHQSIAELAPVAHDQTVAAAEQGAVTGELPLTPIQRRFFEQEHPAPDHWNQSVWLEVPRALNADRLKAMLRHLLDHHDALRLRFHPSAAGWRQRLPAEGPIPEVQQVDLAQLGPADRASEIRTIQTQVERGLSLADGRLMGAALVDQGANQARLLLLTIHHLAVDGVSWWTLLQDLDALWRQQERGASFRLPPKTSSFKQWAESLERLALSPALQAESDYWLAAAENAAWSVPVDRGRPAPGTIADARTESVRLTAAETRALLHEVPAAYQTRVDETLLAALAQALAPWTGRSSFTIALEGHGREVLAEDLDLTRTVGWFTSVCPVRLSLPTAGDPGQALTAVKEQLRALPNRGLGYGLLRYLDRQGAAAARLRALPEAPVLFNYLGQLDRAADDDAFFTWPGRLSLAAAPRNRRQHGLEINAVIVQGCLQADWTFNGQNHDARTVTRLAEAFLVALRRLIDHCRTREAVVYTPADFPEADLSQAELDSILEEFDS